MAAVMPGDWISAKDGAVRFGTTEAAFRSRAARAHLDTRVFHGLSQVELTAAFLERWPLTLVEPDPPLALPASELIERIALACEEAATGLSEEGGRLSAEGSDRAAAGGFLASVIFGTAAQVLRAVITPESAHQEDHQDV